jgi:hypothetical protein
MAGIEFPASFLISEKYAFSYLFSLYLEAV